MYGQQGFCLIWAINNAFKRKVLDKDTVLMQLVQIDKKDKKRSLRYFIANDGIDFKTFKKLMKNSYGIQLFKVKNYSNKGKYLLTYDFGDYFHTVAMNNGEVIDSRKTHEITTPTPGYPLVDVYRVSA